MMMYLAGNFQFDFHTCFLSENEIEFFNSLMETKKKNIMTIQFLNTLYFKNWALIIIGGL